MTITNRLTLYFQLALAVVLVGFSVTLYCVASWHLHAQADRHLRSALELLVAAIEVHPGDVQWEPLERKVTLGNDADPNQVRWILQDDQGELIDSSQNMVSTTMPMQEPDWRLMTCQLRAGAFDAEAIQPTRLEILPATFNALPSDRSAKRTGFVLTVGLLNAPLSGDLRRLALTMTGVSLAIWFTAALWGRWLCRRALRPVRQMADTARSLQTTPDSNDLICLAENKDELTDLGEAFNGLLSTLRDTVERQRRFAGDASHQLRTPLTAILAAVDVALRREREPAEYQRVLTVVQARVHGLTKMVETLLALTRPAGAEGLGTGEAIDLNQICADRWASYPDCNRADDVKLLPSAGPARVLSYPVLVGQVFDNLLDNAMKYSEPGTPILIQITGREHDYVISVCDQGPGIPPEELAQVFQPFFRGSRAQWDGKPGIGLGLAIAHHFAQVAGGRLEVESVVGQGSQFRLVLPADEAANRPPLAVPAGESDRLLGQMESLR